MTTSQLEAGQLEALDCVPAPVIFVDRRGKVIHWNLACGEIAARSLEDVRGHLLAELAASPDDAARTTRAIAEVQAGGPPIRATWQWLASDGTRRMLAWSLSSKRDDDERIVAVALDVSEISGARDTVVAVTGALVRNAPVGILISDPQGRYVDVSDAMGRMVGRARDELVGTTILDLIAPEEVARWHAVREHFLADQTHFGRWNLRHADGSDLPVEIHATVTPDGRWHAFVCDLRERRAQELASERLLQESEADRRWLHAVLDTVPVGVVLFEADGRLTPNRHAEEIVGITLTSEGGSAQYASRLFHPDGRPVARDELISTRVLRDGVSIVGTEMLLERPDGARVTLLGSAGPIRDEHGTIIGVVAVFQDVSERARANDAIRTNERLLDGIFDLLPVGVWITDPSGRIVRTNPAGVRVWGGARDVAPTEFGQHEGWWADDGRPIAAEEWPLARALHGGETSIGEILRIRCFDGSYKTIRNSAMPLRDEHGGFAGAIVVNEDITALRETEDALRRAVLGRDEVLGVVAHDLRSPLNAIVMQLALLGRIGPHDEKTSRAVALVQRQTARMDRLIEDLLEIARIDAGRLTMQRAHVSAAALVENVVEPRRLAASDASIELEIEIADGVSDVWGDHEQLARVLDNLVGNAMKFTGEGGRITVRARPEDGIVVF